MYFLFLFQIWCTFPRLSLVGRFRFSYIHKHSTQQQSLAKNLNCQIGEIVRLVSKSFL